VLVAWGFFLVDVVLHAFGHLSVADYLSWLVNYEERQTEKTGLVGREATASV
jgi:RNase P/RNase MRP subunit POP5